MIKAGIVGEMDGAAGELVRLLLNHPDVEIIFVSNKRHAGKRVAVVYEGLQGECDLAVTDNLPLEKVTVLFLCHTSGETKKILEGKSLPAGLKIIDFSADYRITGEPTGFIYGLPELNRRAICHSNYVANPGSFATCIQLSLLPLAKHLMLNDDITVNAIAGSTVTEEEGGAVISFNRQVNNIGIYAPFTHPDIAEIKQSLRQLQNSFDSEIDFIPYRGNFSRGIFATTVVKTKVAIEEIIRMYEEYYAEDSFVHLTEKNVDLKQVINTNKCLLHLEKHANKLLVISCIDNLLKGASGQAVHNMNLLFGLEETVGLKLKASAF